MCHEAGQYGPKYTEKSPNRWFRRYRGNPPGAAVLPLSCTSTGTFSFYTMLRTPILLTIFFLLMRPGPHEMEILISTIRMCGSTKISCYYGIQKLGGTFFIQHVDGYFGQQVTRSGHFTKPINRRYLAEHNRRHSFELKVTNVVPAFLVLDKDEWTCTMASKIA